MPTAPEPLSEERLAELAKGDIMARQFRKKPVVIEAVQYNGNNAFEIGKWMGLGVWGGGKTFDGTMSISTLEGEMNASPGDWIIRGVMGEFYPIKDAIFRETYDPVEDAQTT